MPISAIHSFRFAPFSSIDCTPTTTRCLRPARICLFLCKPAFSSSVAARWKCRLEGKGKTASSASSPLFSLITVRSLCSRGTWEASQLALVPFVKSSDTIAQLAPCPVVAPRPSRVVLSSPNFPSLDANSSFLIFVDLTVIERTLSLFVLV